ncbi:hypothetical protein EOM81_11465 [bacterium]|nr:hypothetical protein [bacterium]
MAGPRLCLWCDEFKVIAGEWDDICPDCKLEYGVVDRPELPDVGDCECWFDGSDNKIHHCQQRRELAKKQTSEGKIPVMPQCAICETKPEYMPKKCAIIKLGVTKICENCGAEYSCLTKMSKFCWKCKNERYYNPRLRNKRIPKKERRKP